MARKLYIFKVALKGYRGVWRRIAATSDQTLADLHRAIFLAYDRDDPHLYSFFFHDKEYRGSSRWMREAVEYEGSAFDDYYSPPENGAVPSRAERTRLDSLKLRPKQVFFYLFDFGDEWWHRITVEKLNETPLEGRRYPEVQEYRGEAPPQYPDEEDDI